MAEAQTNQTRPIVFPQGVGMTRSVDSGMTPRLQPRATQVINPDSLHGITFTGETGTVEINGHEPLFVTGDSIGYVLDGQRLLKIALQPTPENDPFRLPDEAGIVSGIHGQMDTERRVGENVEHPYLRRVTTLHMLTHPELTPRGFVTLALEADYIPGSSVAEILDQIRLQEEDAELRQNAARTRRNLAQSMVTAASANQQMLRKGLLHRDIKPSNMIVPEGHVEEIAVHAGVTHLIDTGCAQGVDDAIPADRDGTEDYKDPLLTEIGARAVGIGNDVYSHGAAAAEMLTDIKGQSNFAGPLLERHGGSIRSLYAVNRLLNAAMDSVYEKRISSPLLFSLLLRELLRDDADARPDFAEMLINYATEVRRPDQPQYAVHAERDFVEVLEFATNDDMREELLVKLRRNPLRTRQYLVDLELISHGDSHHGTDYAEMLVRELEKTPSQKEAELTGRSTIEFPVTSD